MERKQNVTIGPRYQVRLGDLRQWHLLEVTCLKCRHKGDIQPDILRRRLSDHTRLVDIEGRFACKACGNRYENSWRVMAMSRNV